MAVGSLDTGSVMLKPNQLNMTQKIDMTIFMLSEWNLDYSPLGPGLRMAFSMKRKFSSEMMTTYFPSLLLIAITFATTFFKPFFFEAALSVNLTTMLVLTTIFISKMESLPPTSDIKMIDAWLILCQMVPFSEVIILTALEYNRVDSKKKTHKKKLKRSRNKARNAKKTSSGTSIAKDRKEIGDEIGKLRKCWLPSLNTLGMCHNTTLRLMSASKFQNLS